MSEMGNAARAKVAQAIDLIDAGKIDHAETLCRESLASYPDDFNLLGLLGAILVKKGESAEAEKCLLRTIELEPAFPKPYEDLGLLYLARNEPDKAERFLRQAATVGDGRQSAMHLTAVANNFLQSGTHARARQICDDILQRDPRNVAALRLSAIIATEMEQFGTAENCLRRIAKLLPEHTGALLDLGRFLGERRRYIDAIEVLEDVLRLDSDRPDIHALLGDLLGIVGRSTEAMRAYERCLELAPEEPAALIGRGHMLRITGRRDDAQSSYRQCIRVAPDLGDAWWNLASIHGLTVTDAEIRQLQLRLESGELAPESEVGFRFALARALEDREDFAGAWEHFKLANDRKRTLVEYDSADTELELRTIRDAFGSGLFGDAVAATPKDKTPIFIVGMPRSGSTLIEQILASHSRVEGAGELPYIVMLSKALGGGRTDGLVYPGLISELDASELIALGKTYLHYAARRGLQETPFFTDKLPANFSHVGFIRLILPYAKVIDARRNPMATCVANYRQLFAQGKKYSYELEELGRFYLQYTEVMDHWDRVIPGTVLHIQYEDVVADLEVQVRRILDFCELPFEDACIDFHKSARPVNTASAEQVRQPIYDTAIDFWKNYEPYLGELREVLAPVL